MCHFKMIPPIRYGKYLAKSKLNEVKWPQLKNKHN